jgi:hypothetical protein
MQLLSGLADPGLLLLRLLLGRWLVDLRLLRRVAQRALDARMIPAGSHGAAVRRPCVRFSAKGVAEPRLVIGRGAEFVLLTVAVLAACSDRSDTRPARMPMPDVPEVAEVADSSASFRSRLDVGMDLVLEARFVADRVAILDRAEPHLKLFTLDGRFLWAGGRSDGGPLDMRRPQAIAADSSGTLLVLEEGRASEWRLDADSLALRRMQPLPERLFPLGAVAACGGEGWLLYARDHAMYDTVTWQVDIGPDVDWLYSLRLSDRGVEVRPLWGQPRNANTLPVKGHAAVLIARTGSRIVVLHRAASFSPGEIIEFDCAGRVVRTQSERPLITGESMPVLMPRQRANQWTSGVVAPGDGWIVPVHRYFGPLAYETADHVWKTEVFYSDGQAVVGSVVLAGRWSAMDYHPDHGILMAEVAHFIRVQPSVLKPAG